MPIIASPGMFSMLVMLLMAGGQVDACRVLSRACDTSVWPPLRNAGPHVPAFPVSHQDAAQQG